MVEVHFEPFSMTMDAPVVHAVFLIRLANALKKQSFQRKKKKERKKRKKEKEKIKNTPKKHRKKTLRRLFFFVGF